MADAEDGREDPVNYRIFVWMPEEEWKEDLEATLDDPVSGAEAPRRHSWKFVHKNHGGAFAFEEDVMGNRPVREGEFILRVEGHTAIPIDSE